MDRLNKDILKLAVPSIFANITVPIVGMVGIAVAGHLDGNVPVLIGGMSIGSLLFDLLYWNFSFLRIGTGGMTAQAYGRGDMRASAETLLRAVGVSMSIALICILIQWVFVDFVFLFVKCSDEVRALASDYFHIRIWAAPATLTLMALKGWFIGMQDSISPMLADLLINVVNIAGCICLSMGIDAIGFEGTGFNGIAWGTLIAQYSGLIFSTAVILLKYRRRVFCGLEINRLRALFTGGEMRRFFHLNTDLFLRSLCIMGIYAGITVIAALYGDMMLAVSTILVQLMMLFSYFTDGFAYAGEALTGKFIGMRRPDNVRLTVRKVFAWSMGVAVVFMFLYGLFGRQMLNILTDDQAVVDAAMTFIFWLLPMPVIGCAAFTWDGIYVGATASKPIRNSCMWAVIGFFVVWFSGYLLYYGQLEANPEIAVHILMAAFLMHLLIRMAYETALYRRSILAPME